LASLAWAYLEWRRASAATGERAKSSRQPPMIELPGRPPYGGAPVGELDASNPSELSSH
jgi:hypothetical protein